MRKFTIDPHIEIQKELQPGEELLWWGQPDPWRWAVNQGGFLYWGFAIPAMVISLVMMRQEGWPSSLLAMPFFLFALMMLMSPLGNYREAPYTIYAVTDKRAVIVTGAGVIPKVQTYPERDITNLEVVERPGGGGDITFASCVDGYMPGHDVHRQARSQVRGIRFVGIPEVRAVEKIMSDTFIVPASARDQQSS